MEINSTASMAVGDFCVTLFQSVTINCDEGQEESSALLIDAGSDIETKDN